MLNAAKLVIAKQPDNGRCVSFEEAYLELVPYFHTPPAVWLSLQALCQLTSDPASSTCRATFDCMRSQQVWSGTMGGISPLQNQMQSGLALEQSLQVPLKSNPWPLLLTGEEFCVCKEFCFATHLKGSLGELSGICQSHSWESNQGVQQDLDSGWAAMTLHLHYILACRKLATELRPPSGLTHQSTG